MTEKVKQLGLKKDPQYLYFLDDGGNVFRVKIQAHGRSQDEPECISNLGLIQEAGYLYFIDQDGDIARQKIFKSL